MQSRPCVGQSTFGAIWNVLYPKALVRKQKDIPGTCSTCYKIEQGRKTSECAEVQAKYREAHALHRGGCFMVERDQ